MKRKRVVPAVWKELRGILRKSETPVRDLKFILEVGKKQRYKNLAAAEMLKPKFRRLLGATELAAIILNSPPWAKTAWDLFRGISVRFFTDLQRTAYFDALVSIVSESKAAYDHRALELLHMTEAPAHVLVELIKKDAWYSSIAWNLFLATEYDMKHIQSLLHGPVAYAHRTLKLIEEKKLKVSRLNRKYIARREDEIGELMAAYIMEHSPSKTDLRDLIAYKSKQQHKASLRLYESNPSNKDLLLLAYYSPALRDMSLRRLFKRRVTKTQLQRVLPNRYPFFSDKAAGMLLKLSLSYYELADIMVYSDKYQARARRLLKSRAYDAEYLIERHPQLLLLLGKLPVPARSKNDIYKEIL